MLKWVTRVQTRALPSVSLTLTPNTDPVSVFPPGSLHQSEREEECVSDHPESGRPAEGVFLHLLRHTASERVCVCVCVCVGARACVCADTLMNSSSSHTHPLMRDLFLLVFSEELQDSITLSLVSSVLISGKAPLESDECLSFYSARRSMLLLQTFAICLLFSPF